MLQINTGKLFTRGVGPTNELTGVLYTNARLRWRDPIRTAAGSLRATGWSTGNLAVVFDMVERIEAEEDGPGVLVSHGVEPFLQDFAVIASFCLGAVFSLQAETVRSLTGGAASFSSYRAPSSFIARHFDSAVNLSDEDTEDFARFVDQLLGLERKTYLAVMRALRTFVAGLHRVGDDLAVAYTLMVSAVEALAQDFDGHQSVWSDVSEHKRRPLDKALAGFPEEGAEQVRSAILRAEHVALARRYRAFVASRVNDTYFRQPNASRRPVSRPELEPALRQAYELRSAYIHRLQALPDPLSTPFDHWETVDVERRPALTFQGLYRLTRHVIRAFIAEQTPVEAEPYPYKGEEAGVVMMAMAPQYWVWHPLGEAGDARKRLEGLLQLTASQLLSEADSLYPDMRPMLADVERLLGQAPRADRPALLAAHLLYNLRIAQAYQTPEFPAFLEHFGDEANTPHPDTIVFNLVCGGTAEWPVAEHQAALEAYFQQRYRLRSLHAPRLLEAAISLDLADKLRAQGDLDGARRLISQAVEIHPAHEALRDFEASYDGQGAINWRTILLPPAVPLETDDADQTNLEAEESVAERLNGASALDRGGESS